MTLSDVDRAICRATLAGVELEKLARIRKIHQDACERLIRRGGRAYWMHSYCIDLIDQILSPDEGEEDPADVWAIFDAGPHGVTARPQEL